MGEQNFKRRKNSIRSSKVEIKRKETIRKHSVVKIQRLE